jgi:hypothetical protein
MLPITSPQGRRKYSLGAVLLLVCLTGCASVRSNQLADGPPEGLASAPDQQICQALGWVRRADRIARLESEAQRRGLGDCSAAHFHCVAIGARMGTPNYIPCRMQERQNEIVERAVENQRRQIAADDFERSMERLSAAAAAYNRPAPIRTTNCTRVGHVVNCQSF